MEPGELARFSCKGSGLPVTQDTRILGEWRCSVHGLRLEFTQALLESLEGEE